MDISKSWKVFPSSSSHLKINSTCVLSRVCLFANLLTVAHQAPLPMGFSRRKYWSGSPFPPAGYLPDAGIKPMSLVSPALQADSLPLSHLGSPVE